MSQHGLETVFIRILKNYLIDVMEIEKVFFCLIKEVLIELFYHCMRYDCSANQVPEIFKLEYQLPD